jgi:hypothetical protein
MLAVPTTTGAMVPCEVLASGAVVARATVAGPLDLCFDDRTYALVDAPQDTGDWTIEAAAIATPGTSSPLTATAAGVAGRLYVLILARSSAADPFTTVTSDGAGNTWTQATFAPTSGSVGRRIEVWYLHAADAFTAVEAAFTGAGTAYASLYEITGHDTSTPIDEVDSIHRSSSTTPAALEITPGQAGTLAIAAVAASPNGLAAITPSAGWTSLTSDTGGPAVVYQVDPPTSPIGVSWTLDSAAGSGHAIATIAPAP